MASNDSDIVMAVTVASRAEEFLSALGATGDGLGKKLVSIKSIISGISPKFLSDLQLFNSARNKLVHSVGATVELAEPFALFASKVEMQIEYYSREKGISLGKHNNKSSSNIAPPIAPIAESIPEPRQNGEQTMQPVSKEESNANFCDVEILPPTGQQRRKSNSKLPRNWIVDGTDGLGDFETIQEAIDASNDGDIIKVVSGRYVGPIIVDKALSITGQGEANNVIISGISDLLTISGAEVKIANLVFESKEPLAFGILGIDGCNITVSDCIFDTAGGIGIAIFGDSKLRSEGCGLRNCLHALRVSHATVEVFGNKFAENTNAILLQTGAKAKVHNNDFIQNGSGVEIQDYAHGELSGNRFAGGAAGVVAYENATGAILSNEFAAIDRDLEIFFPTGESRILSSGSPQR